MEEALGVLKSKQIISGSTSTPTIYFEAPSVKEKY